MVVQAEILCEILAFQPFPRVLRFPEAPSEKALGCEIVARSAWGGGDLV